jgi:hypothetical protein
VITLVLVTVVDAGTAVPTVVPIAIDHADEVVVGVAVQVVPVPIRLRLGVDEVIVAVSTPKVVAVGSSVDRVSTSRTVARVTT